MSDNPYESELLEYVEDALDPKAMAVLRARLASDDELREKLERLRRDRTLLRSLGEPELPVDFIASLEPALARPLLIEAHPAIGQPGVYRRRQRRRQRRRHRAATRKWRVGRYALVAIVLVALGAGIWITAMVRSSMTPAPGPGRTVAVAPSAAPPGLDASEHASERTGAPANALADGVVDDAIDPGADVHHLGPIPSPSANTLGENTRVASERSRAAGGRAPLVAPLVMVIAGDDVESTEALLQHAVAGLATEAESAALVRNFSMAEARRLEEQYFPAAAGEPAPVAVTGLGTGDSDRAGAENTRRQRERLARMLDSLRDRAANAEDEPFLESRLIYGVEGLASFEKQLELSGRGATHTIAVPSDAFGALLRGLHRLDGPAATLRSFDGWTDADGAGTHTTGWIAERRVIDTFMKTLRDPDASGSVLLIPVVIE